jgi:hypothetical protein
MSDRRWEEAARVLWLAAQLQARKKIENSPAVVRRTRQDQRGMAAQ